MKEIVIRTLSGFLYVALFVSSLYSPYLLVFFLFWMGLICLKELNNLIALKGFLPYIIFVCIYLGTAYVYLFTTLNSILNVVVQILHYLVLIVQLLLIIDLFSHQNKSLVFKKKIILTTFYFSSAIVFIFITAFYNNAYNPLLLLGVLIIIWVYDTFAFLIGKHLGKFPLFPKISPKKTIEGVIGGLFFSCLASFFIAKYTEVLHFHDWFIISIIVIVFGTLGDLIESKLKRQAHVKESGFIMPGHGGLLDRFDSIIFAITFVYLYLKITTYVS